MDIRHVRTVEPPGVAATCPLTDDVLSSVWGTTKPTRRMAGGHTALSLIARLLWHDWHLGEEPVQSFYCVLYKSGRPSEIFFVDGLIRK